MFVLGDEIPMFFLDGPWSVYCYGSIKMSFYSMMGGNFFSYPGALMMYQLINSCLLAYGKTELATTNHFFCAGNGSSADAETHIRREEWKY